MNFPNLRQQIFILLCLMHATLSGCASFNVCPYENADKIAAASGFHKDYLFADTFELLTYSRITSPGSPVTVYIEGDGSSWLSRHRLSPDPTPHNPIALKLAALDQGANVVYLARPCQYVLQEGKGQSCLPLHWSTGRFAEEIIAAMDAACTGIKKTAGASELHLVGYSGGGAIAVLLAARRDDIASIRTVAGNLDHAEVNRFHGVSPLTESLNPIDVSRATSAVPQLHFVGDDDTIVPPEIAHHFLDRQNPAACGKIIHLPQATHTHGWEAAWPELLRVPMPCMRQDH